MQNQIIYRHEYNERIVFVAKPDAATRKAMVASGFTYNGTFWA